MDYTYEYFIHGINVYPTYKGYQNVVCRIVYTMTGYCGGYSNSNTTADWINYEPATPFITYENVTKQNLIDWLVANVPEKIAEVKAGIKREIDQQLYSRMEYLPPPFEN
jgi:hypothetical protein